MTRSRKPAAPAASPVSSATPTDDIVRVKVWLLGVSPMVWRRVLVPANDQVRAEGFMVLDEDVARLSPLIHDHINMLGRYSFAVPESVIRGELRPLRNPADGDP